MSRRVSDAGIPVGIWLVAAGIAHLVGFRMYIPWGDWHLLDAEELLAHPWGSLCLLHSQPPVLNLLLAGVLTTAGTMGVAPEVVAGAVFAALGLVVSVVLYDLIRRLTGSSVLAALGLTAVVADPAYHVLANLFFYEFLLHVLLVLGLAASARYLAVGGAAQLLVVSAVLGATALTRTLFHPVWAVGLFTVLVALRARCSARGSAEIDGVARAFLLLLVLLAAWPAKNALVFGEFRTASLSAFSLARAFGCHRPLRDEQVTMTDLDRAGQSLTERALRACGTTASAVLTNALKHNPRWLNFNHVTHLAKVGSYEACTTAFVTQHWDVVLRTALGQYAMWTQAAFVHPYHGQVLGPRSPSYRRYAALWQMAVFPDLRPAIERLWPGWFVHELARMPGGRRVPYTLFGLVTFPAVMVVMTAAALRRSRAVGGAVALLIVAIVVPPMVATCLTDGLEGNRMRFATMPVLVVGVCWLLGLLRSGPTVTSR